MTLPYWYRFRSPKYQFANVEAEDWKKNHSANSGAKKLTEASSSANSSFSPELAALLSKQKVSSICYTDDRRAKLPMSLKTEEPKHD
jgi:hypothetical protein